MNNKYARALALSAFLMGAAGTCAQAVETYTISGGGKDMFSVHFLEAAECVGIFEPDKNEETGKPYEAYKPNDYIRSGIMSGAQYWADVLGAGAKLKKPVDVYVHGEQKLQNASAGQDNFEEGKVINNNAWAEAILNGRVLAEVNLMNAKVDAKTSVVTYHGVPVSNYGIADLTVGDNFGALREKEEDRGWWTGPLSTLPDGEQAADLDGCFRHEMGHALGISAVKDGGKKKDAEGLALMTFSTAQKGEGAFYAHLVDENLNPAKAGMEIITPTEFERRKAADPTVQESDFFILTDLSPAKWKDGSRTGKAYFIGSYVTEALDGKTFDGVSGLRINGWENTQPELSHIQSNGMMAHAVYSNYSSFMEVELAVMQDLGYQIDRRKWFGRSIYTDGGTITNTQGFFERNADGTAYLDGTPSTAPLGIGLHVYGSGNTVTQAADLLADGHGASGVRVDGHDNALTLAENTRITANGFNGIGVLFAYGRNHTFTQKGAVEASGAGGIGVRFDFGSSSNGAEDEYRGSYIRFIREVDAETGAITEAFNRNFTDTPELLGPLVSEYTLSGSVKGENHAVYIGRNAFVKDINVLGGAKIEGDITSDWKHFKTDGSYDPPVVTEEASEETESGAAEKTDDEMGAWDEQLSRAQHVSVNKSLEEDLAALVDELNDLLSDVQEKKQSDGLCIQYGGKAYSYDTYIPDLVTNLNFNGDVTYAGTISGPDNIRLNVQSGTFAYGGAASVVNVEVSPGATLAGGTYIVNDMSGRMAPGMTDEKAGKFINHGAIVPNDADMSITGGVGFESDGVFGVALKNSSTAYKIAVKGMSAIVGGSTVAPVEGTSYQLKTKYTFLTADGGIEGTFGMKAGDSFSDLLAINELDHDDQSAWLVLGVNEAAAGSDGEKDTLNALADSDDPAAAALLSQSGGAGKKALAAAAENPAADAAALTIRGDRVTRAVNSRAGWLNDLETLRPRQAHYWFKADKDWSRYGSGTIKGSGFGFTLGADWQTGKNWTVGLLGQYGRDSWNLGESSWNKHKVRDWRFGVYAVNRTGQNELSLHAAVGRQSHENDKSVMGLTSRSKYHSNTQELGLRFARDLTPGKTWHHKPFAQLQLTRYHQSAFDESGAPWSLHSDSVSKLYSAGTVGWGVERRMKDGKFGFSLGYKRVFSGDDPAVWTRVSGRDGGWKAGARKFDRNLFTASAQGEWVLGRSWSANFGLELEQGRHDRNLSAKAAFCLSW